MMELIDKQAAVDALGDAHFKNYGNAILVIKDLPSAEPVRHGKWIWNGDTLDWERLHYCSECKKYALRDTDGKYEVLSDFCPHCGADMRPGNVTDV
jgi:hypothetical protein